MKRPRVFLDTGVLLASVLPKDPDHRQAIESLQQIAEGTWWSAHTSDYVLAEALNFIRMKVKRKDTADALLALVFGADDAAPMVASVLRIHGGRFARALERYQAEFDRGLSLTDWTTVVAMQEADIAEVATFDERLRKAVTSR